MNKRPNDERVLSYRDLRVWKEAMDLAVDSYRLTKGFPRDETFGLTAQIRRAASSVPANISEGYGRESPGHYVNFLRTAQGSLKEIETHILLSNRVGLMEEGDCERLLARSEAVGKMLRGLIRSIQQSTNPTADCRLPTADAAEGRTK